MQFEAYFVTTNTFNVSVIPAGYLEYHVNGGQVIHRTVIGSGECIQTTIPSGRTVISHH